nr:CDP-alcohol phosphatidyltransferase family protein [Auraticoccus cholistanensis]
MIAAAAARVGATPNQVTLVSGLLTLSGLLVVALVPTSVGSAVAATALLALGYAFDSADGQLARLTRSGSPAGEWLDHVVDAGRNPALHLAVLVALFRFSELPTAYLWVPLAFTVVVSTRFLALILAEQLRGPQPATAPDGGQRLRSLMQLPSDTGVQNLVFLLLPWPTAFATAYGVLFVLNAGLASASLVRKQREMARLPR